MVQINKKQDVFINGTKKMSPRFSLYHFIVRLSPRVTYRSPCHTLYIRLYFDCSRLPCVAWGPSVSEHINETRHIQIRGAGNVHPFPEKFRESISRVLHAVEHARRTVIPHRGKACTGLYVREYSLSADAEVTLLRVYKAAKIRGVPGGT